MPRLIALMLFVLTTITAYGQTPIDFSAGGTLAYGGAQWQANGRINRVIFFPGETVEVGLSVGMRLTDGDVTLPYTMGAVLAVKQIFTASGIQIPYDPRDAWSPFVVDGLPLSNVNLPVTALQSSETTDITLVDDETLSFTLAFRAVLPTTLEDGLYAVVLLGYARVDNSEPFDWYANRIFSTTGTGGENDVDQRLPLILRVGDTSPPTVEWVLNQSVLPSSSLGALVNTRRIIQPPGDINLVPSLAGLSFPPVFPSGALTGRIESLGTPDLLTRHTDDPPAENTTALPVTTFSSGEVQNGLFQLVANDPAYQVTFVSEGLYRVVLNGTLSDTFGNQYRGGGTYEIAIAQPLQLLPAVPSGYPLVADTPVLLALTVWPSLPAQAEVTVTYQPSGGDPQVEIWTGQVQQGRFVADAPMTFATSGTYQIRYRVEGTDADGRFWVGETHTSGVITDPVNDYPLTAHGRRGLDGYNRLPQAYFDSAVYPFDAVLDATWVNTPYNSGDVVFLPAAVEKGGLRPVLTLQDNGGEVAAELVARLPGFVNPEGDLAELIRRDSLPIVYPNGYGLLTLNRFDGVVNAMAQASADGLYRPLIGLEDQPDGTLLTWFGGIVLTDPPTTSGYGASVIVTNADSARVLPHEAVPLQLVTVDGHDGSIVVRGSTPRWMGLVLPVRAVDGGLSLRLTAPDGSITRLTPQPVGFHGLYAIDVDSALLTEAGVWRLQVQRDRTYEPLLELHWIVADQPFILTSTDASVRDFNGGQATIRIDIPDGWTDLRGTVIVTHPQGTLDVTTSEVSGRQWVVNLNRTEWVREFGWAEQGIIQVTLALVGVDADGSGVIGTRTLTLQPERLVSIE